MLSSSKTWTLLRSVHRTSRHLHYHRTFLSAARNLATRKISTLTTVRTVHASVPAFSERPLDSFDDYFGIEHDAQERAANKWVPSEEIPIEKIRKETVGDIRGRILGREASVPEAIDNIETNQHSDVGETESDDWSTSSDRVLQMSFGSVRLDSMNEPEQETESHSLDDGDLGFIEAQYFRDLARDAKSGVKVGDEILHDEEFVEYDEEPESEFPTEYNEMPKSTVASQSKEGLNYFDQLLMNEDPETDSTPFGREPFPTTPIFGESTFSKPTSTPITVESAKRKNLEQVPQPITMTTPLKKPGGDRKSSQSSRYPDEMLEPIPESLSRAPHSQSRNTASSDRVKARKPLDDFPGPKPVPKELEGTAYELSQKIRAEQTPAKKTTDSQGFLNPRHQVEDLTNETRRSLVTRLKYSVLYNYNDILAIDKPYGLATQDGTNVQNPIDSLLPKLAEELDDTDALYQIHRLDKNTTGTMLFAKTKEMQQKLIRLMQKHKITKKYWVLTKGVPEPESGIVDIPMVEGTVEGRYRMALAPDDPKLVGLTPKKEKSVRAVTRYRVLDKNNSAALVECEPLTGIKHQIRCHLSHGLNCPVLGDHKYSHFTKLAPQKLYPETLQHLGIRQSKVRNLPMHIHASSVYIPEVNEGKGVFIKAKLPRHFMENMRKLKINIPKK